MTTPPRRGGPAGAARQGPPKDDEPFHLVTFRGDGPWPGIDLDRTSELLEIDDLPPSRRSRTSRT